MVAEVCTSASVNVCTAECFERKAEGKAVGFDFVVITVDEVSVRVTLGLQSLCFAEQNTSINVYLCFPRHRRCISK